MMGFRLFAEDHKGHLPGNFVDYDQSDRDKRAWLINYNEALSAAPQGGTIFRYVRNEKVYRCPAQDSSIINVGVGSNGRFDYAAFGVFTGALTSKIKVQSRFEDAQRRSQMLPTPVLCEEEPRGGVNGGNVEGLHNVTDRISSAHHKGGYYASLDGSVHWFREPPGTGALNWFSIAPSGKQVSYGNGGFDIRWGWWNVQ
jgi:hypothetical protein